MIIFKLKKITSIIIFPLAALAIVGGFFLGYPYLYHSEFKELYMPKITNFRIENSLIQKGGAPLDVMTGTKILISGDVVIDEEGDYFFRLKIGNNEFKNNALKFEYQITEPVGTEIPVEIEYLSKNGTIYSHKKHSLVVTEEHFGVFIHSMEDEKGKITSSPTVPMMLRPYGKAILPSDFADWDFKVIFFVREYPEGVPVLQVTVSKNNPSEFVPVTAKLEKYRRYGSKLSAFAFWSEEYIQIGNVDDERKVFSVVASVVRKDKIDSIKNQAMIFDGISPDGKAHFRSGIYNFDEVKKISDHVSEYYNLVRGPANVSAGAGGNLEISVKQKTGL
jgi:hypothetical protein